MSTFNSRVVITFPGSPQASAAEFELQAFTGATTSPFTGSQQVQSWQSNVLMCDLTFPPMLPATAAAFTQFLVNCQGVACCFQLPSWLQALVPAGLAPTGYWSLANNQNKFSIGIALLYGFNFQIREVIAIS